ncbi:hypothetical protein [Sphingomonas sp. PP-CC-3A-396]|uniref:hypothetical protein n=1 Tax=Sphingomonas sp. PP-CC-3A-396 TaxID=2135655 RepID=UPI001404A724|nr:hypothetical protein [Sphingomonas sp. PP-CC-3A-396]
MKIDIIVGAPLLSGPSIAFGQTRLTCGLGTGVTSGGTAIIAGLPSFSVGVGSDYRL